MSFTLRVFGLFCLISSAVSAQAQTTTSAGASLIAAQVANKATAAPATSVAQEQPVTTATAAEPAATPADMTTLTGRVLNEDLKPLAGVVVFIKDAAAFASTDAKGEYRLEASAGVHTLTFSYAGYEDQQLKASDFLPASVQLLPAANKRKLTKSSRH